MLLNFRVSNYKSIKEEVELSLIPANTREKHHMFSVKNPKAKRNGTYHALTSVGIYGANASGKSNLIEAFNRFLNLIRNSSDNKPDESISQYKPFKLDFNYMQKPTAFSLDLVVNNVLYEFNASVSKNKVVSESLFVYPNGKKLKVYSRKLQKIIKGNGYKGAFETIRERTTPNQLFLSKAANENVSFAYKLFHLLNTYHSFTSKMLHNLNFNETMNDLMINEFKVSQREIAVSLIQKLDTQIINIVKKNDGLKTIHIDSKGKEVEFDISEESSGTQRIIAFVQVILTCLAIGSKVIVDEFERSLHPEIAKYLLSLFNDPEINTKGSQFIFATHDVTLLSQENKMRRDQIYLIEKNKDGASELYAVSDIKGVREGNLEKWYLEGRLGAIPTLAKETFKNEWLEFMNMFKKLNKQNEKEKK